MKNNQNILVFLGVIVVVLIILSILSINSILKITRTYDRVVNEVSPALNTLISIDFQANKFQTEAISVLLFHSIDQGNIQYQDLEADSYELEEMTEYYFAKNELHDKIKELRQNHSRVVNEIYIEQLESLNERYTIIGESLLEFSFGIPDQNRLINLKNEIEFVENQFDIVVKAAIDEVNKSFVSGRDEANVISKNYTKNLLIAVFIGVLAVVASIFYILRIIKIRSQLNVELKSQKEKAEKASQAKTELLSNVSHELKTPLNAIFGTINLMKDELDAEDTNLMLLEHSAKNLNYLISDIIDSSQLVDNRIQLDPKPFHLERCVMQTFDSFKNQADEKGLTYTLIMDDEIPYTVLGDEKRLYQILHNLLSNAIKFTHVGSVVFTVKLLKNEFHSVTLGFSIKDTGIGIDDKNMPFIFNSFFQGQSTQSKFFQGTGLGLAIVKGLLNLMGSDIKFNSKLNEGSNFTFELELPVVLLNAVIDTVTTEKIIKRILLVEDNDLNIAVTKKFISKWGHYCEIAKDGHEGVTKFKSAKYHLILMDIQMPGMDGFEACQKIREWERINGVIKTPIIALTASAIQEIKEQARISGMDDFISKPFDPKELELKINRFIHA